MIKTFYQEIIMLGFLICGKCSLSTAQFSGLQKVISIYFFKSSSVLSKMTKIADRSKTYSVVLLKYKFGKDLSELRSTKRLAVLVSLVRVIPASGNYSCLGRDVAGPVRGMYGTVQLHTSGRYKSRDGTKVGTVHTSGQYTRLDGT